ncbi:uncharacterized protein I206_104214 [Kwoniella pini CBS 10737]|uniref:Protein SPT2 n=1 Tax=Kwoniella pini CBS 10737 TaxID=1296096 RepID=A0A1B9I2D4_9TREE|nr:uncharacterized protein I206_04210 [Kwoniella pini CBS 10737]OCF49687.1 hypothetical protein I206_04210 [Kwoniella pini CBS 10737]
MSEYQVRKARMLELQREKEEGLKRELAAKAAREKQIAKEAEELRKRQEAAAKEARRLELMRANEALNKKVGGQASKELEYNPFAEDARPPPSAIKPPVKPSPKAGPSRPVTSSKQSVPGPPASKPRNPGQPRKARAQSNSPPPLGRKEKAAKAFAQSAKKSAGDSLFSVRNLVESREIPPAPINGPPSRPRQIYNNPSSIPIHGLGMSNGLKRDLDTKNIYAKTPKSTREYLSNQAKLEGMRKLCPDRETRDRRSIEEIQRDIKAKRGLSANGSGYLTPPVKSPLNKGKERLPPVQSKPNGTSQPRSINPPRPTKPPKRKPSSSSSETDSSDDARRRKYGRRSRSPPIKLNEHSSHMDIRSTIQDLFRRPGARPTRYQDEFSDSGSEDMEAGLTDVEEEERRAARIARREDELAELEEKRHREEKLKKKREAERRAKG